MHSAPTIPPDLSIAWRPDGLFARASADEDAPDSTVFWFLASFWGWIAAIPVGMAAGSSTVTLALALFAAFAAWRTHDRAPRAVELRGDTLTIRGFDRTRVPLHRVVGVELVGARIEIELDDGEVVWLCVESWSRAARRWAVTVITQAARRVRRVQASATPLDAAARRSLARLQHQLRARRRTTRS